MSLPAKKIDDIDACRLLMHSKQIVLAITTFLNLASIDVVYYDSKDLGVQRREVLPPYGAQGTRGLISPVPEALVSNLNRPRVIRNCPWPWLWCHRVVVFVPLKWQDLQNLMPDGVQVFSVRLGHWDRLRSFGGTRACESGRRRVQLAESHGCVFDIGDDYSGGGSSASDGVLRQIPPPHRCSFVSDLKLE